MKIVFFIVRMLDMNWVLYRFPNLFFWNFDTPIYVQNKDGSKTPCVINYYPVLSVEQISDGGEYFEAMKQKALRKLEYDKIEKQIFDASPPNPWATDKKSYEQRLKQSTRLRFKLDILKKSAATCVSMANSYAKIACLALWAKGESKRIEALSKTNKDRMAEIITDFEDGKPISKCRFSYVPLKYLTLNK